VLPPAISESVLLLDTMGELRAMYQRATIAFVGGSILPGRGGQSLAEPAAAGVPVLFGPHYETQREAGDALLETGGGRVVADTAQLESTCAEWLTDDALRTSVGERALAAIERLGGGTTESLRHLTALVSTCK
jgi:3-deoxy-D-manno-octulosonic-acid transferase